MLIIGIDPDVERSGIATIDTEKKSISVEKLSFFRIVELFRLFKETNVDALIRIEAGWLNKSNWHVNNGQSAYVAAKIGNATGRNHQTGILLGEVANGLGLDVEFVKPLRKIWKGQDKKISQYEIEKLTGYHKRMTQDMRDALLIAWVRSKQ